MKTGRVRFVLLAAGAVVAGACSIVAGLQPAELIQQTGTGTTGTTSANSTSSSSSTTGSGGASGSGGSAPTPICVDHFANVQASAATTDLTSGAIYITGKFSGMTSIGSTTLTAIAASDMFVAKLDECTVEWAKQAGSMTSAYGIAVAAANNEVALTGNSFGMMLGGKALPSGLFAARYGGDGSVAWATGCAMANGVVAIDPTTSDPLLAGTFTQLQCGSMPYYAHMDTDIFVTRLDATQGSETQTWTYDSGDFEQADAVVVDTQGAIFFGGRTEDNLNIGPMNIQDSMYAARVAGDGTFLWGDAFGEGDVQGLALDSAGGLFVTAGCSAATNDFGGTSPLPAIGPADICIAKLTAANGGYVWARRFGVSGSSSYPSSVQGIAVNSAGDIAVAGTVNGAVVLDGNVVTTKGFVALLSGSSGKVLWVDGLDFDAASVTFTAQDALVVAGTFGPGSANFGTGPLTTASNETDSFVLLIKP